MKDETRKLLYQIHAFSLTYIFFATVKKNIYFILQNK